MILAFWSFLRELDFSLLFEIWTSLEQSPNNNYINRTCMVSGDDLIFHTPNESTQRSFLTAGPGEAKGPLACSVKPFTSYSSRPWVVDYQTQKAFAVQTPLQRCCYRFHLSSQMFLWKQGAQGLRQYCARAALSWIPLTIDRLLTSWRSQEYALTLFSRKTSFPLTMSFSKYD